MKKTRKILFVCTGNTCRSSMAEVLFKKILKDNGIEDVEAASAGTSVFFPSGASEHSIEVMRDRGIDLTSHQSRQVTKAMIHEADIILTMTVNHREKLLNVCPEAADKVFTLKEFAYGVENADTLDISDPFGLPKEYYEQCSDEIYRALEKVVERIRNGELL